jgi:ribonuclease HI
VLIGNDGFRLEFSGAAASTTNNRMEITAAIEALRRLPAGLEVTVRTDSQYLVNTMTLGWKRRENLDLWKKLDSETAQRKVCWQWVRGHSGNTFNERADELARNAALGSSQSPSLDSLKQMTATLAGQLQTKQSPTDSGTSPKPTPTHEPPTLSNEETNALANETEITRLLRPLLAVGERLRRCAGCHRAFVTTEDPPRMRAYCSLAACQLKRRRSSSS